MSDAFLRSAVARLTPVEAAGLILRLSAAKLGRKFAAAGSGSLLAAIEAFLASPEGQELMALAMQLLISALTPKPSDASAPGPDLNALAQAVVASVGAYQGAVAVVAADQEQITEDQQTVANDQTTLAADQQTEATDLAAAQAAVQALAAALGLSD